MKPQLQLSDSHKQLYSQLSSLLEQCLIVDNFTKDVDRSLQSYIHQQDGQETTKAQEDSDDFFYQSVLEH